MKHPIHWTIKALLPLALLCAWLSPPTRSCAAQQDASEVQQLRQQLNELRESFELLQREHRAQLDALSNRIDQLMRSNSAADEKEQLARELERELGAASSESQSGKAPSLPDSSARSPLQLRGGTAYMDLGLSATFAAGTSTADDVEGGTQLGGHDPNQRGFTVQGLELSVSGAIDPYFRGSANLLFGLDSAGESFFELEEAWLETFSLPANLQLRAGQLMTEFGRQNTLHPHAWAFVDAPLVLARFLGADGLRNPGARLSWLVPTPFYSELFLSIQDSHGETAPSFRSGGGHTHGEKQAETPFAYRHVENDRGVSGFEDLLFTPRYAVSFDLTESQTVLAGFSAAFGPNSSGGEGRGDVATQIVGADLTWKWKPANHSGGFPFVSFQAEGLMRRYEAGAFDWDENGNGLADPGEIMDLRTGRPAEMARDTLLDYGLYAQVLYGLRKGWVAGLRIDFVDSEVESYEQYSAIDDQALGRDPARAERWRLSPNLTWYPSEFSKIRLQYNYDRRTVEENAHSVWLQFEFLLGAHAAHKF